MTFVRAKLALEQLAVGEILRIRLRDGEPRHNVPRALARPRPRDHRACVQLDGDLFELRVRKQR